MMKLPGLLLLVAMCVMIGRCKAMHEDLCKSFTDEGAISNGSNTSPLKLTLQHTFLQTDNGIVPGLRYNGKCNL